MRSVGGMQGEAEREAFAAERAEHSDSRSEDLAGPSGSEERDRETVVILRVFSVS
jgi:hypothetical protein